MGEEKANYKTLVENGQFWHLGCMPCQHQTFAPSHVLTHIKEDLHGGVDAEFGAGRQKCAAQAYERGYEWGQTHEILQEGNDECLATHRRAPVEMLDGLERCQAAEGRHVCCVCAYHEGFADARAAVQAQGT